MYINLSCLFIGPNSEEESTIEPVEACENQLVNNSQDEQYANGEMDTPSTSYEKLWNEMKNFRVHFKWPCFFEELILFFLSYNDIISDFLNTEKYSGIIQNIF